MNKNILEEYQKRVEETLEAIGTYQAIMSEGIEESQSRTDRRLAELQVRREELDQPIDMSDISATMIDRSTPARTEYSDDREGYLLSEYDKRRLDGYSGPKFAEIVDEIRAIREGKRLAQIEAVEEEMQALIEVQTDIDHAREAEVDRNSVEKQLQEEKNKIEAKIQGKKEKAKEVMDTFEEIYGEAAIHKQTLTLYKDPNSKVYTAAKAELEACETKAKSAQTRVKRLAREISHLESDLGEVDKLLQKLYGSRAIDEISRQEDEMWREYREEQARAGEEAQKDANRRMEEWQGDMASREAEFVVDEVYADGLNPEEEPIEPQEYRIPVKPKDATNSQRPKRPQPAKPLEHTEPQEPPKPQDPKPKPDKWKVEGVAFSIEGGKNPVYKVIVSNGKEQKEVTSTEIAILDPDFDKDELAALTGKQGIQQADKFYDKGLAKALAEVDVKYGTQSLKEYEQLLKDKEMIHRYPERYEDAMSISYDFSGLLVKPDENMKKLQDLAKANQRKGVVSEFKKRPNFIMRMIKRIFTKALPETSQPISKSQEDQKAVTSEKKRLEELSAQIAKESQDITEIGMLKDWSDLHTEPGFDIEEFVKDMPIEEANKYRIMQDEYEVGLEKDPYAAFRKKMHEEAEKGKQEEKGGQAENTQEPEKDDVIEVDPKDVTVFDADGREIG